MSIRRRGEKMYAPWHKLTHHDLDVHPIPKDTLPRFINEPWLIDESLREYPEDKNPNRESDNIRIYVSMDLNRKSILRRIDYVIWKYGEANWKNESKYEADIEQILSQVEIYDQVWFVRHMPREGCHSHEAISLVKEIISRLEAIPDGCAELFPFTLIDYLYEEYLGKIPTER